MNDPEFQRDLLLGHLALELNFINAETLEAAKKTWTKDKSKPMGEILLSRQAISAHTRAVLENLVQLQMAQDASEDEIGSKMPSDATERGYVPVILPPTAPKDGEDAAPSEGTLARAELRFRKLKPHAQGALGQVFLARDKELRRKVALKEIKERYADNPDARSRFLLEAEITGRLEHPGVVPVYGLGTYASGRPFYAMRFIKGESFADAIKHLHSAELTASERALELRKQLTRFVTVCHTMQYAHDRDIVHRDLKPSNIMLGAYGETLVVDWGLAKVLGNMVSEPSGSMWEPLPGSGSSETLPGRAIGTITYMSPEQAAGRLEQVNGLSDVYSLGATLFTILTGRPSVEDSLAPGQDKVDMVKLQKKVCVGDVLRPRQLKSDVDRALEAIVIKSMALRQHDRYPNARAMAEDLERWLANEPVSAYPEPITVRTRRWVSRHRTLVSGMAAALLVGLFSLGAATVFFADQRNKLAEAYVDLEKEKKTADDAKEFAEKEKAAADVARNNAIKKEAEAINAREAERITNKKLLDTQADLVKAREKADKAKLFAEKAKTVAEEARDNETKARKDAERARDERASTFALNTTMLAQSRWNEGQVVLANDMLEQVPDKFRLGGWHFLRRQFEGSYATLYGHLDGVRRAAFSPDGLLIASGGADGKLKLWDARTGKNLLTLDAIGVFAFSPDSQRLAAAGANGSLTLRDARSGKVVTTRDKLHAEEITSVVFSPDGQRVATGSQDGTIQWCDVATLEKSVAAKKSHVSGVTSLSYSPDGKQLASTGLDKTLIVWNTDNGERLQTFMRQTNGIGGVAFSPDSKHLAFVKGDDQTIKLWKTDALGTDIPTFAGKHGSDITSIAFSPDGRRLASTSFDGGVKVWDVATGKELAMLRGHAKVARSVAFSPDGQRLVSAGDDRVVKLWELISGQETQTFSEQLKAVASVSFSPTDNQHLASGGWNGVIKVWNATTGAEVWSRKAAHASEVLSVAYSADGKRLASGGQDGKIKLWDGETGKELPLAIKGHDGAVKCVTFSRDGKRLASGGGDKDPSVRVWDADKGTETWSRKSNQDITSVSFSPDGNRLAWADGGGIVTVWDLREGGKEVLTIPAHTNGITTVAYSPDGEALVSAGQDGRVSLWDADNGQLLVNCKGHSGGVMGIAFSRQGRRLASAGKDGTIKLWDARTGHDLKTFHGHGDLVTCVAFSPDSTRVASASLDRTVKVWDTATARDLVRFAGEHTKAITGLAFSKDGKRVISRDESKKAIVWSADDAKVVPDVEAPAISDSPAAISPDGKKLALPFANWFYVIELEPSKDEADYRERMSRLKSWWHEQQAGRFEKDQAWYGAAFHWSWALKGNASEENRSRFNAACKNLNEREVAVLMRQAGLSK